MFCWKCNQKQDLPNNKVGFRAICENCGFDLHCCKNCKYYFEGKPNDCSVPNTLNISDKEKFNFCEDFFQREKKSEKKASKKEVSKRLFEEDDEDDSTSFDSLFK
jgi:hypothetical protein